MRSASLRWFGAPAAIVLASLLCPGLALAQSGERSGKEVVDAQCSKCHLEGKGGAPRIGDRDAWVQRLKKGLDATVREAIRGHGGMPARGDKADLTDREVRNAILYMYYPGNAPK
jgi:cytochrome c5